MSKEIKAELDSFHGTSVPMFVTVYNWVNEFKHSRTSTNDARQSRQLEREIAEATEHNKNNRLVDSETVLTILRRIPMHFLHQHLTVDETSIHYYTIQTK